MEKTIWTICPFTETPITTSTNVSPHLADNTHQRSRTKPCKSMKETGWPVSEISRHIQQAFPGFGPRLLIFKRNRGSNMGWLTLDSSFSLISLTPIAVVSFSRSRSLLILTAHTSYYYYSIYYNGQYDPSNFAYTSELIVNHESRHPRFCRVSATNWILRILRIFSCRYPKETTGNELITRAGPRESITMNFKHERKLRKRI